MNMFNVLFRTLFFYVFVTIAYRLMGKREVGQLGVIDLIVSILIAEMVAISIENTQDPLYLTIVPISVLVFLEICLAYISLKNKDIRKVLEGKPSLVISNGLINYHEMIRQRYTLDDLLLALRQKEIKDISEVEYAFLEPNGKLSIFKYAPFKIRGSYPMPLVLDGKLDKDTLKHIKKTEEWFDNVLRVKDLKRRDIFYAFYKKGKIYIIKNGSD